MKKLLTLISVSICFTVSAKDCIYLHTGEKICVTIVDVKQDTLFYLKTKNERAEFLLSSEVAFVQLDKKNKRMQQIIEKNLLIDAPVDEAKMLEGKLDANKYHNRAFGNFCLGFFFGYFGILGTAIADPRSPDYDKIPNKENLQNSDYLRGYEKRARGKNVINASVGLGTGVLLVVLLAITSPE